MHIIGTSFTKLRLFFDKGFFNIYTLFPPLCETLYACLLRLFAKASEIFTHFLFQLIFFVLKTASSIWHNSA